MCHPFTSLLPFLMYGQTEDDCNAGFALKLESSARRKIEKIQQGLGPWEQPPVSL